ncbi:MAG: ATP-binding protein [Anaerolineales bacterium]|nr:ATP-binding protein [Anaerolineales bacterium]
MRLVSHLGKLSFRGDFPGADEIDDLLNLSPCAALLVDIAQRRVIAANLKASGLSAYTQAELLQMTLERLIHQPDQDDLSKASQGLPASQTVELIKRNRSLLQVQATFTPLPSRRKWGLLELEPLATVHQRERQRSWAPQLWEVLREYHATMQADDPEAALQSILNIARTLTGADNLCVYQAQSRPPGLQRYASSGKIDELPERLPAEELGHLKTPYIWLPGKRVTSSLHKIALTSKLAYLATHPLGEAHALIGVLVICSDKVLPDELGPENLALLANTIHATLQQKVRSKSLLEELQAQTVQSQVAQAILDSIQDGVILVSPSLTIQRLNTAAEGILGYTSAQVCGQPVTKVLIGNDALMSYISMARDGIPTQRMQNYRLFRRSGASFPAEISFIPLQANGDNQGVAIILCDLSDKESLEVHNQELEKRAYLGDIVAMFAHDIRNPINNISSRLQLIASSMAEEDANRGEIISLEGEFDQLGKTMNTIVANAQVVQYSMEPLDLAALIKRQVDRMQFKVRQDDIQINLQVEPPIPLIMGDSRALERVFSNLIDNALNAMKGEGGTLVVKLHQVQEQNERFFVEVSVADSGPGIPKDIQAKIFQPFFTTSKSGSGLGLAITQRFVEDHKGSISVKSFPGGTIFFVRFPIIDNLAR